MANAYRVDVGDMVSYLAPLVVGPPEIQPRWRAVKVTTVVSQTSLNLAIRGSDGALIPVNGGLAVPKRSAPPTGDTETNVWRPYS